MMSGYVEMFGKRKYALPVWKGFVYTFYMRQTTAVIEQATIEATYMWHYDKRVSQFFFAIYFCFILRS